MKNLLHNQQNTTNTIEVANLSINLSRHEVERADINIPIQVSSLHNLGLTGPGAKRIPYTLSTAMGSQTLRLVSEHDASAGSNASGIFVLHDLQKDAYAIQGHFDARFLAVGSTIPGEYTYTLTPIFTISL